VGRERADRTASRHFLQRLVRVGTHEAGTDAGFLRTRRATAGPRAEPRVRDPNSASGVADGDCGPGHAKEAEARGDEAVASLCAPRLRQLYASPRAR
jgi:hypothetical protein